MGRYQVILAYDGTLFQGFQVQGKQARTVQGVVESSLRQIGWQGRSLLAAGRTDTGVHATGQVIAFDLEWAHSLDALLRAINANLPPDVAAQEVRPAPADFHPRFYAVSRRYRYHILHRALRAPLQERYAWRLWPALDLGDLQRAASLLHGRHDFAAFGSPPQPGGNTYRTIQQVAWNQEDDSLTCDVQADAFLYHMVRRMVFIQVAVAQGRLEPAEIAQSLQFPAQAAVDRLPGLAPACGLVLVDVAYLPDLSSPRIAWE